MENLADLPLIGVALLAIGLVLWTVGGFVSFRTRYDVHNRQIRANFDPGGKPARVTNQEIWDAYFKNPKSRWWCLPGWLLFLAGFALLALGGSLESQGGVIGRLVISVFLAYGTFAALRSFFAGFDENR